MVGEEDLEKLLEVVEGERFDPGVIEQRIERAPPGKTSVFKGKVSIGEIDIVRCKKFADEIQSAFGIGVAFIDDELEQAKTIVEHYGGYWIGTVGDAVQYVFPVEDLEKTIRCTFAVKKWVDRELTHNILDYVIAYRILKEDGNLSGRVKEDKERIKAKRAELQQIKYVLEVATEQREEKERYRRLRKEMGDMMKRFYAEERFASRGGIAHNDELEIKVTVEEAEEGKRPRVQVHADGHVRYLLGRLMGKDGPMGRTVPPQYRKDRVMILSEEEIPKPAFFTWMDFGLYGEREELYGEEEEPERPSRLVETWGSDNFNHPTFDGRLPEGSTLTMGKKYRELALRARDRARTLEDRREANQRSDWLDFTERRKGILLPHKKPEEAKDYYKNGRTMMASSFIPAVAEQICAFYDRLVAYVEERQEGDDELAFFGDPRKDRALTEFVERIRLPEKVINLTSTGIVYSNGGALKRLTSAAPQYPNSPFEDPRDNVERIKAERDACYASVQNHPELEEWNVVNRIGVQHLPVSEIEDEQLAMDTLVIRLALRYIHYTSDRAWRERQQPEEAMHSLFTSSDPRDFADLLRGNGFRERNYEIVCRAFAKVLNLPLPYTKQSAA